MYESIRVIESFFEVTTGTGFWFNMGLIITVGMIAGFKFNESLIGLKRSLAILLPFSLSLVSVNAFRIFGYSQSADLGANAYNGTISVILTTVFYMIGLFFGHVLFKKAKHDALKDYKD